MAGTPAKADRSEIRLFRSCGERDERSLSELVKTNGKSADTLEPIRRKTTGQRNQEDIEIIYGLGFFSLVDVSVTSQSGGVYVEYQVTENPIVQEIRFAGNTVFTAEELMEVVFTQPGAVFNRVFFRNDLQRIGEKYEKAGYVMTRIEDVGIEGGIIDVRILEPVVGEVIIQGNKKTKTEVIRREFRLQPGDIFNATIMRHSLNKINNKGFFEDVSVGFEPTEDPGKINIVLTVQEGKTAELAFSIGHGSSSGWTGGASYKEKNYRGLGHLAELGFETGDKEQYWLSYEEPYMDGSHYRWKAGVYLREWSDIEDYTSGVYNATYNQDKKGVYYGKGKEFTNNRTLSWFALLDWNEVEIEVTSGALPAGKVLDGRSVSITGSLTRNLIDEYLSFPKGQIQSLSVQHGLFKPENTALDEISFTKYWLEAKYYWPLYDLFEDLIDREVGTEDNPVILAARFRVGYSSGDLPWTEQYFLGGSSTLRGYKDDEFYGDEMVLGNVELRIPIQENFSVVGFYDIGMASDGSAFSDSKNGYGIGVRVRTPIGNLRLDFASGEYENRTHFSFGEMF